MMKAAINRGLALFLAAWMVISTGGYSIYAHNCDCCGIEEISVLDFNDCCSHENTSQVCDIDSRMAKSCCADVDTPKKETHEHQCQSNGCCNISQNFFKLESSFDTARPYIVKSFVKLAGIIQVIDTEDTVINSYSEITDTADQGLKYLTGRTFVLFSHQLKISFPV